MNTSNIKSPAGPLCGVRVLDLTSVVLGPMATQIMGDFGADIIKIESLEGDLMRANGVSRNAGMSSIYLTVNRNKRSVAIDLKKKEGLDALKKILPTVDVVIHNMRVAAVKRLGLDYENVKTLNPNVVYCAATGYGQSGPDAGKPVFDDIIQAACGIAGLINQQRGEPDYFPTLIADKTAGLATANAVMAALYHREKTGQGQYIEVPMFETMVAFTLLEHQGGQSFEPQLGDVGYTRLMTGGRKPAKTSDGVIAILPYTGEHWGAFFTHAGRGDILEKYNLNDRNERNDRIHELYEDLNTVVREMTSAECMRICEENDIPSTPIYALNELIDHPHLKAVGMFQHMKHPTEGATVQVRPAALFEKTPAQITLPAPTLGQHTTEVLTEAGIADEEIRALLYKGIIKSGTCDELRK